MKAKSRPAFRGLVAVEDRKLYAEYQPAAPGQPILVLLNGLSMGTNDWDGFLGPLIHGGRGYLRFDFRGQARSLAWELDERGSFERDVTVHEQTRDLAALLEHFGVQGKLNLVATSYGGGVALCFAATYPERIDRLVLLVPYLIRLDHAHPLQRTWASQLEMMRGLGWIPGGAYEAAQRWYHQFLDHYMDHRYGPHVPDARVRAATIRLTFGIMGFNAFKTLHRLPAGSVHLVSVGRDTLVPRALYSEMWSELPAEARASWLYIEDGEHLLLEQCPAFCARWIESILAGDARVAGGRRFHGQAYSFEILDDTYRRLPLRA